MQILFVDDDVDGIRLDFFKKFFANDTIVHRENPIFVSFQDLETSDLILLDNDMCLRRDSEICPTSNSEKCLCESGDSFVNSIYFGTRQVPDNFSEKEVIIHSMNNICSERMHDRLSKIGVKCSRIPFSDF